MRYNTPMRATAAFGLIISACGQFLAACAPADDPARLRHPLLPDGVQAEIRAVCAGEAARAAGPPPDGTLRTCRDDGGDAAARDRCRLAADLAFEAQARHAARADGALARCLRVRGFVD
jgi:hypothetical protein